MGVQAGNNFKSGGQTGLYVQGGNNKVLESKKKLLPLLMSGVTFHYFAGYPSPADLSVTGLHLVPLVLLFLLVQKTCTKLLQQPGFAITVPLSSLYWSICLSFCSYLYTGVFSTKFKNEG